MRQERARRRFATTRWTIVLQARDIGTPAAREALASLSQTYWYPLYVYVRRRGVDADAAQDLVQDFLVNLIEKDVLKHTQRERGRFRSFLLASMKHFLINEFDRSRAQKRGGGLRPVPLDLSSAESRYAVEPPDVMDPEKLYERRWAATLIDQAQARLRAMFTTAGRGPLFEHLKDFLERDAETSYRDVATTLNMSEGAVKVAVHRMRRRFKMLLREEITQTVADPVDVETEIRFLLATVSTRTLPP